MRKQAVEFAGEAVGALVPDDGQLRFIAVKYSVWSLDGRRFATPDSAIRAIAALHGLRHHAPASKAAPRPQARPDASAPGNP